MNKIIKLITLALLLFMFSVNMVSAADKVNIYVFYGRDCPHCKKEKAFLESIKDEYNLEIFYYETWYNKTNLEVFKEAVKIFNEDSTSVPYTIIGDKTFVGYSETMNNEIIGYINGYEKDNEKLVKLVKDGQLDGTFTEASSNKFIVLGFFGAIIVAGVIMFLPTKKGGV